MFAYIYRITNTTNKKTYIGYTQRTPEIRFKEHIQHALKTGYEYGIHRAIRKYGLSNFIFEVLYVSKDISHTLEVMEPYFIEIYGARTKKGYNMAIGGRAPMSGKTHTDTAKSKMKLRRVGRTPALGMRHSDEAKQKISKAHIGHNYNLGRIATDETKEKMSLSRAGNQNARDYVFTEEQRFHQSVVTSGQNNPNARVYEAISPDGTIYKVIGSLGQFLNTHKLPAKFLSKKFQGILIERTSARSTGIGWKITCLGKYIDLYNKKEQVK